MVENSKSKYKYQIKHLKNNYKKFHIDFKNELFDEFLKICKKNQTTPTTEIKKFVEKYIEENKS